jgi:two-component system, OmpR family, response regulator AdeR
VDKVFGDKCSGDRLNSERRSAPESSAFEKEGDTKNMMESLSAASLQTMDSPLIMVVEDEPHIAEMIVQYLKRSSFRTEHASNGLQAVKSHRTLKPNLVLLDIQLPGIDGIEVLKRIRAEANTAIIMLTARHEDLDKLEALTLGADDYIVKPFSPIEMVARVKAVLRRTALSAAPDTGAIRIGPLEVNAHETLVKLNGNSLSLTPSEYNIIEHLAKHLNSTVARAELLEVIVSESEVHERIIDAHMSNLRRKFIVAGAAEMIETVRGIGYRLWHE